MPRVTRDPITARAGHLRRKYGITQEQYDDILAKQSGCCAICSKTPEDEGVNLAVDHNHKTGEIRGILCRYCNHRVVGRHTDGDLLRRVASYLDNETGLFVPVRKRVRKPRKAKTKP